jgi:hypothetical protein
MKARRKNFEETRRTDSLKAVSEDVNVRNASGRSNHYVFIRHEFFRSKLYTESGFVPGHHFFHMHRLGTRSPDSEDAAPVRCAECAPVPVLCNCREDENVEAFEPSHEN